jgi:arylsulfatase A-like enzyme
VTLATALVLTSFDAVLLQLKKSFFTGGFLTEAYTHGKLEALGFLSASLLVDAGIAGLLGMLALVAVSRVKLTPLAGAAAVLLVAAGPLLLAELIQYSLLSYLGDAFDFGLMFDLTGRNPAEIAAVSTSHLVGPALLFAGALLAAVAVIAIINRRGAPDARRHLPTAGSTVAVAACVFLFALVVAGALRASSETFDDGLQRKASGRFFGWLTEMVTDVDRDGYGIGGTMPDPAPFNSAIYPYALDRPGDGIDQDGVAGDLPADAPPYEERSVQGPDWPHKPNVVLIVLETFRADAVGRTIDGKVVTPTLDDLAKRGVSAPMAYSHNGYTAQSRFHIFSGSIADLRGHRTLVDDFKRNGYEVAYFSAQDESFGGAAYGVGFDRADVHYDARQDRKRRYTSFTTAGSLAVPYSVLQERIDAFLGSRTDRRPLFLYINFHDTHYPYHHQGIDPLVASESLTEAQIAPGRAADVQRMYYNTAANVDRAIGGTLQSVTRTLGAPPAVVVLGDHGESLFDGGFLGHGYALNDVQTRIPLIAAGLPIHIEQPFGQADLRDTIGNALARAPGAPPEITVNETKTVFQYLGRIDRPRQIAFASGRTRMIYDFRTALFRESDTEPWQSPPTLQGAAREHFTELVRLWERMVLARSTAASHDSQ